MAIEIVQESAVSLTDLQELHKEGISVVRTAHVGNSRAYNLAAMHEDLPIQLVDHTIVAQYPGDDGDTNYLPGSIVTAGSVTPLELDGPSGRLTSMTQAGEPGTRNQYFAPNAVYLDVLHVTALRQAFPHNPSIRTNTDYVRNAEAITGEVVKIALETMPLLFNRVAMRDGTVRKVEFGGPSLVKTYGILQLNDDPRSEGGVLIPNDVMIVLGFVIEALQKGGNIQYHLSGPDFYQYIKDYLLRQVLNKLYGEVKSRASFGPRLPETLRVNIVPATEARFAAAKSKETLLLQIFSNLTIENQIKKSKDDFFRKPPVDGADQKRFIEQVREREKRLAVELGSLALESPELFIGPKDAPFTSQYDVLASGGLVMPEGNASCTMNQLQIIHRHLAKGRDQAMKRQMS